jgi:hypothetical protein
MKKQTFLFISVVVVAVLALAGCQQPSGGDKDQTVPEVSATSLAASGATTSITTVTQMDAIMPSISGTIDPGISVLTKDLSSLFSSASSSDDSASSNVSTSESLLRSLITTGQKYGSSSPFARDLAVSSLQTEINTISTDMKTFSSNLQSTGKADLSYNKSIDSVTGLPTGITLTIPNSTLNVSATLDSGTGILAGTGTVNLAVQSAVDMTSYLTGKSSTVQSAIKAAVVNAALKGSATLKKYDMTGKTSPDGSISMTYTEYAGISFCCPDGTYKGYGGKLIGSATISYNGTAASLETLYKKISAKESITKSDFTGIPLTVNVSENLYSDDGTLTLAYKTITSAYELYTQIAASAE